MAKATTKAARTKPAASARAAAGKLARTASKAKSTASTKATDPKATLKLASGQQIHATVRQARPARPRQRVSVTITPPEN